MRQAAALKSLVKNLECLALRGVHTNTSTSSLASVYPIQASLSSTSTSYQTSRSEPHPLSANQVLKKRVSFHPKLPVLQNVHTYNCLGGVTIEKIGGITPNVSYECPEIDHKVLEIETPSSVTNIVPIETPVIRQIVIESPGTASEKLANAKLRRRRRSMKKHQRLRLREKIWPEIRKARYLRRLRKKRVMNQYVAKFKKLADDFDGLEYIKTNLKRAKDKGYQINIFGPNSKSFGFTGKD